MPSDRKQFNVRMTDAISAKVDHLLPALAESLNLPEISQSQFFAACVNALEEKLEEDKKRKKGKK